MTLDELLKKNKDILVRLATKGAEYYTPEQFLKSFKKTLDNNTK